MIILTGKSGVTVSLVDFHQRDWNMRQMMRQKVRSVASLNSKQPATWFVDVSLSSCGLLLLKCPRCTAKSCLAPESAQRFFWFRFSVFFLWHMGLFRHQFCAFECCVKSKWHCMRTVCQDTNICDQSQNSL